MRETLRLPFLLALQRCSFRAIAERDALRAIGLDSRQRRVNVGPRSPREKNEMLLYAFGKPEARTVFYHRLGHGGRLDQVMGIFLRVVFPGQAGVEIRCPSRDIGAGFVLGHGQASVIWAKRIGEDCTIFQHVTLGLSDGHGDSMPTLGDRAWIWPGAKVIGRDVGDDATIGAGAVVIRENVPAGRTAVGVPARLI